MNTIKQLRQKSGLSQAKFAKEYGLPLRTLQRWEQCQNSPPGYITDLIRRVMECESKLKRNITIPENLRYCFWDADFDKLNLIKNRDYIIARLFTKGGLEGIKWVVDTYPEEDVRRAACRRRDLNPIAANYLSQQYNIDRSEMRYYCNEQREWR